MAFSLFLFLSQNTVVPLLEYVRHRALQQIGGDYVLSKQETEKANVFIASPFYSTGDQETLAMLVDALDMNIFVEGYFNPLDSPANSFIPGTEPWRKATFTQELHSLEQSNFVVAVADADGLDTDPGTAYKLGLAFLMKKPVILLHEGDRPLSVMIAESAHAVLDTFEQLEDYNFIKKPAIPFTGMVK